MSCVCWVCNYCNGYRRIQLLACYTPRPRVPPWITRCPPLLWRNSSSADLPDIVWAGIPLWYSSSDCHPHFLHMSRRCVLWIPLLSYKWHRVWVSRYTFYPANLNPTASRATCETLVWLWTIFQQTQSISITFVQCWTNVEDVGPTLYRCYRWYIVCQ